MSKFGIFFLRNTSNYVETVEVYAIQNTLPIVFNLFIIVKIHIKFIYSVECVDYMHKLAMLNNKENNNLMIKYLMNRSNDLQLNNNF